MDGYDSRIISKNVFSKFIGRMNRPHYECCYKFCWAIITVTHLNEYHNNTRHITKLRTASTKDKLQQTAFNAIGFV